MSILAERLHNPFIEARLLRKVRSRLHSIVGGSAITPGCANHVGGIIVHP